MCIHIYICIHIHIDIQTPTQMREVGLSPNLYSSSFFAAHVVRVPVYGEPAATPNYWAAVEIRSLGSFQVAPWSFQQKLATLATGLSGLGG